MNDLKQHVRTVLNFPKDGVRFRDITPLDDLLATGGTALAMAKLIEKEGGIVVACEFLINLVELGGKNTLSNYDVRAVMDFTENE